MQGGARRGRLRALPAKLDGTQTPAQYVRERQPAIVVLGAMGAALSLCGGALGASGAWRYANSNLALFLAPALLGFAHCLVGAICVVACLRVKRDLGGLFRAETRRARAPAARGGDPAPPPDPPGRGAARLEGRWDVPRGRARGQRRGQVRRGARGHAGPAPARVLSLRVVVSRRPVSGLRRWFDSQPAPG